MAAGISQVSWQGEGVCPPTRHRSHSPGEPDQHSLPSALVSGKVEARGPRRGRVGDRPVNPLYVVGARGQDWRAGRPPDVPAPPDPQIAGLHWLRVSPVPEVCTRLLWNRPLFLADFPLRHGEEVKLLGGSQLHWAPLSVPNPRVHSEHGHAAGSPQTGTVEAGGSTARRCKRYVLDTLSPCVVCISKGGLRYQEKCHQLSVTKVTFKSMPRTTQTSNERGNEWYFYFFKTLAENEFYFLQCQSLPYKISNSRRSTDHWPFTQ